MKAKIMVVDDTEGVRDLVGTILQRAGYEPIPKCTAAELVASFEQAQPDVVLLDLGLPDGDGMELLPKIKKQWPDTEVIMLTGNATFDKAVEATKLGAYHFQAKPFDQKILLLSVERALEHRRLNQEASSLREAVVHTGGGTARVFQSPAMKAIVRTIERVAPSDVSILITGESGTGKEVIADMIHTLSPHSKGPLIKINCAALPRELIESELFGSVKGAFTGATADREGLFRQAEEGTLLLDELSEMPIDTQSKLLRVLQEKEVRPVGGRTSYKTNCRIIAATNRQTDEAIKAGKLREDLFYRISAISVISAVARQAGGYSAAGHGFFKAVRRSGGRNISGFSDAASDALRRLTGPATSGNCRTKFNALSSCAKAIRSRRRICQSWRRRIRRKTRT